MESTGPEGRHGRHRSAGCGRHQRGAAAFGTAFNVGAGQTVVSKFAPAGSWVAFASIDTNSLDFYFEGDHSDRVECFLRAPGRVVSSVVVRFNAIGGHNTKPTISLVGAFTLTADATPDVFCSSTLGGQLAADLVLLKVGSIA